MVVPEPNPMIKMSRTKRETDVKERLYYGLVSCLKRTQEFSMVRGRKRSNRPVAPRRNRGEESSSFL
jgi:hypothetical protein